MLLGSVVCCDGFALHPVRVITHVHDDHIRDFETSLHNHDAILMLPATKDLLFAIKGKAGMEIRNNLISTEAGKPYQFRDVTINLSAANHMLGSSQVLVEHSDGYRLGYTGDFGWPVEPLRVDELVVDATYGNPAYVRSYGEDQVVEEFVALVSDQVRQGRRVCIKAYLGRLQLAMQLLQQKVRVPFLAGKKQASIADVYRQYGMLFELIIPRYGDEGRAIAHSREPFIGFHHLAERVPETEYDCTIYVSSFMVPLEAPVIQTAPNHYRVALTDHADFNQTLEYISLARPKKIILDNSRGGDAWTLAEEIRARLNLPATIGG